MAIRHVIVISCDTPGCDATREALATLRADPFGNLEYYDVEFKRDFYRGRPLEHHWRFDERAQKATCPLTGELKEKRT